MIRHCGCPCCYLLSIRWEKYELSQIDIWALAHSRYQREMLSEEQSETWDRFFPHMFSDGDETISRARWEELHYGFDREFGITFDLRCSIMEIAAKEN